MVLGLSLPTSNSKGRQSHTNGYERAVSQVVTSEDDEPMLLHPKANLVDACTNGEITYEQVFQEARKRERQRQHGASSVSAARRNWSGTPSGLEISGTCTEACRARRACPRRQPSAGSPALELAGDVCLDHI